MATKRTKTLKIKTYAAKLPDGRTVRCTVPENDEGDLFSAVREQLSPEAVAAIAAHLLAAKTNNAQVDKQVAWFTDALIKMLGTGEYTHLCEGLGL